MNFGFVRPVSSRCVGFGVVNTTRVLLLMALLFPAGGCDFGYYSKRDHMLGEQTLATHATIEIVRTTDWRVTRIDEQDVPHQAERGSPENITVMMEADGRVRGSSGVNQYSGTYKLTAPDQLRFSQLVATRRAGPPEAMQRERRFFNAMDRVRSFRLNESPQRNRLELLDAEGKVLLQAVAE